MQRLRWERYEIESYLVHPAALARYVEKLLGSTDPAVTKPHIEAMNAWMNDNLPPAVMRDPLSDHDYLRSTKAREKILSPVLSASGVEDALGLPYTRYWEIASLMLPEEIHPEVKEKLDLIMTAFGL